MIRESQFQKAELKRMEKMWKEKIASLQAEADTFITKIETMKIERKNVLPLCNENYLSSFRY